MNPLSRLSYGVRRPRSLARDLNRAFYSHLGANDSNPTGTSIFEEDWDNLVVLSGCRYDVYSEVATIPGDLSARRSLGASTREYVAANFGGRRLHDTVCLTVDGWDPDALAEMRAELHALVDLERVELPDDAYDPDADTPKPEVVSNYAAAVASEFPTKRLVVHYDQPRYPYLGSDGRSTVPPVADSLRDAIDARDGETTVADVRRAYRENLELVLDAVEDLLPELVGKTVVTADHGTMLGERHHFLPVREYGTHRGIYNDYLTEVPWHVVVEGSRKRVTNDPPVRRTG